MFERITSYRRNLRNFIASVVLGGLAISFLSSISYGFATGSTFTNGGAVLGVLGVVFLVLSGYFYLSSQNPGLVESDSWDFILELRKDGTPGPDWMSDSFPPTSRLYAPIAYGQLLQKAPEQRKEIFSQSETAFALPSTSIAMGGPLGDRMDPNKEGAFVSELMDYLMLVWMSGLQSDIITSGGKVVQRIELFHGFDGQTYTPEQLQAGPGVNRFVRLKVETGLREIKLPADVSVAVHRSSGVYPRFTLATKFAEMQVTYSIYFNRQWKDRFEAKVRISCATKPKRAMWPPSFRHLFFGGERFPSDVHYRSFDVIHENLRRFFPEE